jgi:hypothetical protein
MAKVIVYTRPDGGVSVCVPNPDARQQGETVAAFLQRIAAKDVPADATNVRAADTADLPASRRWRDAWRDVAGAVGVDIPAARLVKRAELLRLRDRRIAALRDAIDKADDDADAPTAAGLRAKRRRLRNLDATFDSRLTAAATLSDIDAVTDADLA